MLPLNCIVVDDSMIFRKVVRDCLKQLPEINIVDIASDGIKAIEKITEHRPDLVTLDVEMPGCDGLDVLKEIRRRSIDCDVIMVSSQTDRAAEATTRALSLGAFDYVLKPNAGSPEQNLRELLMELNPKVEAIRRRRRRFSSSAGFAPSSLRPQTETTRGVSRVDATVPNVAFPLRSTSENLSVRRSDTVRPQSGNAHTPLEIIVIGVSTGGPSALREILPKLPTDLALPVLIVQHMPPLFTASLARDLNDVSSIQVCEASHRQAIRPGNVYIAPGGAQMKVAGTAGNRFIEVTDDPPVRACKPSVDYLFESVAKVYGASALAIVLTGMGNDGTAGCRVINQKGGRTIAQDEASCTVFGMPRQVIEAGLAQRIEPLNNMAATIIQAAHQGALVCL